MKTVGIYGILNRVTWKWYIGSSVNIRTRRAAHLRGLRKGAHTGPKLLRAWQKYGEDVWVWVVLEEVKDPLQLLIREQYWVDHFNSYHDGYNSLPFVGKSLLGTKQRPESAAKRVATRRANGTYTHSEATKKLLGDMQRGKKRGPMSGEQKLLIAKRRKETMTDEEKQACGDRARGREYTAEQRERMAAAHRGKTCTPEARKHMSECRLGKPKDPESIKKMLLLRRERYGTKISQTTCEKYGIPFE